MTTEFVHPAIVQLLHHQAGARLRRVCREFSTPRRFLLSCLGIVLAVIWLGNAAASILLREPADPARFRTLVPLGLLAYALWHVLRVACYRPEEAITWTPTERELLCAAPFRRRDLVAYRFGAIASAALLKSLCFSLLMLPDLTIWPAGFVGALLALLFLDLVRMLLEIAASGVTEKMYGRMRSAVVLIAGAAVVSALISAASRPMRPRANGSIGLLIDAMKSLAELRATWIGAVLQSPFQVFSQIITAEAYSVELFGRLVLATLMVAVMAWSVVKLDAHFLRRAVVADRRNFRQVERREDSAIMPYLLTSQLTPIAWRTGAGPLAWRQAISAHKHAGSLVLALVAPGILACIPLFVQSNASRALLEVTAALAFYSFLLLPAALKFDFRRDFDRIAVLKSLPIRPTAVVTGQIATPVLLASGFQLGVLLITFLIRPVHPGLLLAALMLLGPLNVLIFALDNLLFLLYPYRPNQEGLEIFVRTTLTFTAKGLLFALALFLAVQWSFIAGWIARRHVIGSGLFSRTDVLFVSGVCSMIILAVIITLHLLARAYQRFDPSQDTPA